MTVADPSRLIAALARDQINLELKTIDLCFLAGLYLRANRAALASFEEDALIDIYLHLRQQRPDLRWFVPTFRAEFIEHHGLREPWPADLDLTGAPELVRDLAARSLWLEQERIVVDHRICAALEAAASEEPP